MTEPREGCEGGGQPLPALLRSYLERADQAARVLAHGTGRERQDAARALIDAAPPSNAADQNEISKYVTAISNTVRQSFTILSGLEGLSCTLRITLVPGGEVARVEVMKSSGNPIFDRQAENAVRKASPLPVPNRYRKADTPPAACS